MRKRKSFLDRKHIEYCTEIHNKTKQMNNEQLRYLTNNMVGLLFKYADLYQRALDEPEKHLEFVEQYRMFKHMRKKS